MLKVSMFSSATKIKGQGVASAYLELIALLKKYCATEIEVSINNLKRADISHYHTVDFRFFCSTFLRASSSGSLGLMPKAFSILGEISHLAFFSVNQYLN